MKIIETGYREPEDCLFDRVIKRLEEMRDESLEKNSYLNQEKVIIVEIHTEES